MVAHGYHNTGTWLPQQKHMSKQKQSPNTDTLGLDRHAGGVITQYLPLTARALLAAHQLGGGYTRKKSHSDIMVAAQTLVLTTLSHWVIILINVALWSQINHMFSLQCSGDSM